MYRAVLTYKVSDVKRKLQR